MNVPSLYTFQGRELILRHARLGLPRIPRKPRLILMDEYFNQDGATLSSTRPSLSARKHPEPTGRPRPLSAIGESISYWITGYPRFAQNPG